MEVESLLMTFLLAESEKESNINKIYTVYLLNENKRKTYTIPPLQCRGGLPNCDDAGAHRQAVQCRHGFHIHHSLIYHTSPEAGMWP